MPPPYPPPVVLFDGECGLCARSVQWILRHDRRGVFRFAALQSAAAARLLGRDVPSAHPDSVVLIDHAGRHWRSDAALRICLHLGAPWSWLAVLRTIPRCWRDAVYAAIARRRHRVSRPVCVTPTPEERRRFLDA